MFVYFDFETFDFEKQTIVHNAMKVLEDMHAHHLFAHVYEHIAFHFEHPPLGEALKAAKSFYKASEYASNHLLMQEARKALNQLNPKQGTLKN